LQKLHKIAIQSQDTSTKKKYVFFFTFFILSPKKKCVVRNKMMVQYCSRSKQQKKWFKKCMFTHRCHMFGICNHPNMTRTALKGNAFEQDLQFWLVECADCEIFCSRSQEKETGRYRSWKPSNASAAVEIAPPELVVGDKGICLHRDVTMAGPIGNGIWTDGTMRCFAEINYHCFECGFKGYSKHLLAEPAPCDLHLLPRQSLICCCCFCVETKKISIRYHPSMAPQRHIEDDLAENKREIPSYLVAPSARSRERKPVSGLYMEESRSDAASHMQAASPIQTSKVAAPPMETKPECTDDTKFSSAIKGFLLHELGTTPFLHERDVLRTALEFVFAAKHLHYSAFCFGIDANNLMVFGTEAQVCVEGWWPEANICSIDQSLQLAAETVRELKAKKAPMVICF
jgi:hypothetical protein